MNKNLIIFIDSLPFYILEKNNFYIKSLGTVAKITPGVGFSINLYPELFCGLQPDGIGFFNEWTIKGDRLTGTSNNLILKTIDYLNNNLLFSVISHKLYSKVFKKEVANIPFCYLGLFRKNKYNVFSKSSSFNIFNRHGFHTIVSSDYKRKVGRRDIIAYAMAKKSIEYKENIFVSFVDLDNIAHIFGINSEQYSAYLNNLDFCCKSLIEKFKSVHQGKCNIFIISDHGMAKVFRGIKLNLEKYFGRVGQDRYIYFVDSVFLRVWTKNTKIKDEIKKYLIKLKIGRILDSKVRKQFRISNKLFGDIIFQLDEGGSFCPNYHGWRLPKAMHGYAPELESQKGIFICDVNKDIPISLPSNSIEVYNFINSKIERSKLSQ